MYKAGIIGCGFIGFSAPDNHYEAYYANKKVTDIVMCDTNGSHDYTDYMEMVRKENLDIVSVCTPVHTHADVVCKIAPYVKAIYCEKPIAETLEDANRMIKTCQDNGVVLQINHQRLFMTPMFKFSRGILNTGTHVFSLIDYLFKVPVDVEYVDTEERIFELDCLHSAEKMIPKGVNHLIECLENHHESISSGISAREALRQCLELRKRCLKT